MQTSAKTRPATSVFSAMLYGSVSFAAVSVLAYSIWAFRLIPGDLALYAATAAVYMLLGGLLLSRLVATKEAWKRFPFCFATGFLLYATLWCVCWFGLGGKFHADLWGAAAGLAGMVWWFRRALGSTHPLLPLFAVMFTFHSFGYYVGDNLYALVQGTAGRLAWGAAHGLGFGAGLGYVLFYLRAHTAPTVTSSPH